MSPLAKFLDWFEQYVTADGYDLSRGMWREDEATNKRIVAFWISPGRSPVVDVQYPHIRIAVAGARNERSIAGALPDIENFASGIIDAAMQNYRSGCIAMVRPLGSLSGPSYTDTDRPVYELNFELII